MKLPDVNVFLYAADQTSPRHGSAKAWLEDALSGVETVALAWPVLVSFVRLATQRVVFEKPLTPDQALDLVDGWLARPCTTVVEPTDRHAAVLRDLIGPLGTAGNIVTDAHVAALAVEHGATVVTYDTDFRRFEGVRILAP